MCFALGNLHSSAKHLLLQCRGTEGQRDVFFGERVCVCLSTQKLFCRHVETRGVEREQAAPILKKAEDRNKGGEEAAKDETVGERMGDISWTAKGQVGGQVEQRGRVAAVGPQAFRLRRRHQRSRIGVKQQQCKKTLEGSSEEGASSCNA